MLCDVNSYLIKNKGVIMAIYKEINGYVIHYNIFDDDENFNSFASGSLRRETFADWIPDTRRIIQGRHSLIK